MLQHSSLMLRNTFHFPDRKFELGYFGLDRLASEREINAFFHEIGSKKCLEKANSGF